MNEAVAVALGYLGRSNVDRVAEDETAMIRALDLLEHHRLGRDPIADSLLAATFIEHGVVELITCNQADFEIFEDLTVIDPRGSVQL